MNFLKFKPLYFFISGMMLAVSIFSLIRWEVKPAVDFTGGSILEIKVANPELGTDSIGEIINNENPEILSSIQSSGKNTFILRMKEIDEEKKGKLLQKLKEKTGQLEELRFESVGPTLGKELLIKTGVAVLLAAGFILAYVAWAFKDKKYGICAILAMIHDSLIMIGVFSLLGHFLKVEVDTLFVTALLTTLSFSVHDTVVVYDRIRESVKQFPQTPFRKLANKALTETMARSLNNSFTIIFMLTALLLLGGATIKWFALALLVGTVAGTYSSPFVAVPLLDSWVNWKRKKPQTNS